MTRGAPARALEWLRADLRRFDLAVATITLAVGTILLAGAPERFDTGWPEVAAGVGAFVLLLFRRHHTLVLMTVAMAWTAIHVAIWQRPTPMVFAILVLLATACVRLERWQAIGLGVGVAVSLYVLGLITNDVELADSRAVIGIVWTAVAVGVADATRSWRRYRESADAELRSAMLAAEARSQQRISDERLTIARELHDLLAHNLSVMNVQTGAAQHLLRSDPDQAEASLAAAREAGRNVLDELSGLLAVLRRDDDTDEPTSSLPTVDELPALVESVRASGLDVGWTRSGEPRSLSPSTSLAAYRITQEALTNASKHGVGRAEVTTEWRDDGLSIEVVNESATTPGDGSGHGVVGMRERAAANGGTLRAERVGERFVVTAFLPAIADRKVST